VHEQEKLVAALAGQDVAPADQLGDSPCGLTQHLVAGGVPERVVDELEVVQVEVEERDGLAGAPGAGEVGAQPWRLMSSTCPRASRTTTSVETTSR
jgi:hypothetical protein